MAVRATLQGMTTGKRCEWDPEVGKPLAVTEGQHDEPAVCVISGWDMHLCRGCSLIPAHVVRHQTPLVDLTLEGALRKRAELEAHRDSLSGPAWDGQVDLRAVPAKQNLRAFGGIDPGNKGAAGLLVCLDDPSSTDHGKVVDCVVFDLETMPRDSGGCDLCTNVLADNLYSELVRMAGDAAQVDVLVERPSVGGKMGRGAESIVAQGINAGAAFAAAHVACARYNRGRGRAVARWVSSHSAAGWRSEIGATKSSEDALNAVMVIRTVDMGRATEALRSMKGRPDQHVAVLIAEVARRRWLGTAATPATKNTAKAAKAKKADLRRAALERTVAPLTVTKARSKAICEVLCHGQGHNGDLGDRCDRYHGGRRQVCCEARLLDWAWRQRPDFAYPPKVGTEMHLIVRRLNSEVSIERKPVTAKQWTMSHGIMFNTKLSAECMDLLIDHGLVQLIPGEKAVRYRPTERGLAWADRLRGDGLQGTVTA